MKNHFDTKAIHVGYPKQDPYGSLQFPAYETSAFEFATAEAMADAFSGTVEFTYSRISNPTVDYFEKRVTEVTGAFGVTAFNSGMAAISNLFLNIAYTGANIVTSPHLFGNTYSLFASTLKRFGVEVRFCDLTDLNEVVNTVDENTCALFLEIITNPQLKIVDLKALSTIARQKNVPLVADTTIVPFCTWNAKDFGVDMELVSSTKYISGGATTLGGILIDYGTFDWTDKPAMKDFTTFGRGTFTAKLRKEIHRNMGAYMTPHAAQAQLLGLETLSLRFAKAAASCLHIADKLQQMPQVQTVNYPGLTSNPFYDLAKKQFGALPGAMLTFDLPSKEACFIFLNRLKLIKRATNLFDNKSLIIHPASTIFGTFSQKVRDRMNISDDTVRLSVGLEDPDDLLDDIRQALGSFCG
jgi:O-acetylhomoserine (thiol)-lyase